MFYSRKINGESNKVEVWECEWANKGTGMARKEYLKKIGDEDEIEFSHKDYGWQFPNPIMRVPYNSAHQEILDNSYAT